MKENKKMLLLFIALLPILIILEVAEKS